MAGATPCVAIVKPDFGVRGGFEAMTERIRHELEARGYRVAHFGVDAPSCPSSLFGLPIPELTWELAPEVVRYLGLLEGFRQLDVSGHDVVLSTQPPSFAVPHARQAALFFHHLRVYYDLSDVYVAAGFSERGLHERCREIVREIDARFLPDVEVFFAPSAEVADRLRAFNGVSDTTPFRPGPLVLERDRARAPATDGNEHVLCVSRHEFPKRTELFVHAMAYLPDLVGHLVGRGGRLRWSKHVAARVFDPATDLASLTERDLWLCPGDGGGEVPEVPGRCNVRFVEQASDAEVGRLYASSLCVVAPAFREDYGLTVLEAMAHGKPVVVCADGGGLCEFVRHGENGLVVAPTGAAIAEALRLLAATPELTRRLGDGARETASCFTWPRAVAQLVAGIEQALG